MSGIGNTGPTGTTPTTVAGDLLTPGDQASLSLARPVAPYSPGWIDRVTDFVERLPGPAWLYYAGFGVVALLLRAVIGWSDGSYPVGTFFPAHVMDGIATVYPLMAIHYLDARAGSAIATFRPVLSLDDTRFEDLRYRLTTMPSRPVLAWSLVGLIFGIVNAPLLLTDAELRSVKYMTSPAASIMDVSVAGIAWAINAVLAYHTVHQLRLVSQIYTQYTKGNVFESGPIYVLSRLTALTAMALLFITYLYLAIYTHLQFGTFTAVVAGIFATIALATFAWPLFGAHTVLQDEKAQRKREVAERIKAIADELHLRVDTHSLKDVQQLKDALDGLVTEKEVLDKVSTWPWEPEVLRLMLTAVLLPVFLWLVTRLLERLGF